MKKLLGLDHMFFAPVWRRVVVVLLLLGWCVFEFVANSALWGLLFLALAGVCAWNFATLDYTAPKDEE